MEYDVQGSLKRSIAKYEEAVFDATGSYPKMKGERTPFITEETKYSKHRAPASNDDFVECPCCFHTIAKSDVEQFHTFPAGTPRPLNKLLEPVDRHNAESDDDTASTRSGVASSVASDAEDTSWEDEDDDGAQWWSSMLSSESKSSETSNVVPESGNQKDRMCDPNRRDASKADNTNGCLNAIAAMMLMTLLYSARVARFDLFKPINFLAKRITRWDSKCDRRLHRLMCYVYATQDYQMVGWLGDHPSVITAHLFCDADFAGCPYTLKSTNGCHADIQGPNTRFPWAAGSNQQTSRAQSTPEAELNSLNSGMKNRGEPAIDIWSLLLAKYHDQDWKFQLNVQEDNTTAIAGARSGKNPTMKTLERGHGVSVGWINERIVSGNYNLIHTRTKHMSADIYTKAFANPETWHRLRKLISIYSPEELASNSFNPIDYGADDLSGASSAQSSGSPGGWVQEQCVNPQYFEIMNGTSTATSDLRNPIKVKKPKVKAKTRVRPKAAVTNIAVEGASGASAACSKTQSTVDQSSDDEASLGANGRVLVTSELPHWSVISLSLNHNPTMQQFNPYPENCKVVELTDGESFSSERGYQRVKDIALSCQNVVILFSLPCNTTGPFDPVQSREDPGGTVGLTAHWGRFRRMWGNFERLCEEAGPLPSVLDWPKRFGYWVRRRAMGRLRQDHFNFVDVQRTSIPMWTFATSIPKLVPMLPNIYRHADARGGQRKYRGNSNQHRSYNDAFWDDEAFQRVSCNLP